MVLIAPGDTIVPPDRVRASSFTMVVIIAAAVAFTAYSVFFVVVTRKSSRHLLVKMPGVAVCHSPN